ncbi:MauE/DoxX family redox-associated membrane protein [Streptomyces alboflavus]|uniref:MauE/DoxX family redox-associated membrane protein n=1 Tax=Streptomyces alboflavus TaxID=67267 RepID=UPI00367D3C00
MEYLIAGARALLGLVFLVSLVGKVAGGAKGGARGGAKDGVKDRARRGGKGGATRRGARGAAFAAFLASVRSLRVVPSALVRPVALTVIAGEAAVCVLLAAPARGATTAGLLVAAALLTAFTVGIAAALRRGVTAPCRCFGASSTPLGTLHLVRNAVLCALALAGALAAPTAADAPPGSALVAGVAGLVAGALVTQLDHLLALFRPLPAPPRTAEPHAH